MRFIPFRYPILNHLKGDLTTMKNVSKRILSVFTAMTLLLGLCVAASAEGPIDMAVGDTETVTTSHFGDSYDWSTTNPSVVSVAGDGSSAVLTALSAGSSTITVSVTTAPTEESELAETVTETWSVTVSEPPQPREELQVSITPAEGLNLTVGESAGSLSAVVTGAAGSVSYSWTSKNPSVATVFGTDQSVTVDPVGEGTAVITVTASDGEQSASDEIVVSVAKPRVTRVMVSASSSTTITLDAGNTQDLAATVSGGSGSYEYVWNESGVVGFVETMRANATIKADNAGTGSATLYVYDAEDSTNYGTVTWNVKVNSAATPLEVTVDPVALGVSVGKSGTLSASATGGSGSGYDYSWSTNNGIVTVAGNGSTATVTGGSAGSAVVTVTVTDRSTNMSSKASSTVTVKSNDASYNAGGTATVGGNSPISGTASTIATAFQNSFGVALSSSASVRLTAPSASVGQLRLSTGSQAAANTSYTYTQFSSMYLYATKAGTFSTAYTINDNGNVLTGTLTLTVSGGTAVTSVSINQTSIDLDLYSSYFLNVGVMPSNAAYTVSWRSSNTNVAYVDGGGNSVTVRTRNREGSAVITATVEGATGTRYERTCTVYVSNDDNYSSDTTRSYNPSLTLTVGSDYYGTNLADNFRDRYRSVFGYAMGDNATIRFSSLGNTNIAVTRLSDGTAVRTNTSYSFAQYAAMSVTPISAGTISAGYSLTYNGNTLSGTITMYVRSANVTASISTVAMTLAPNSNQTLSVNVTPASSYYSVSWSSSNTSVAAVSGYGTSATVNTKSIEGTATITANITDRNGVKVVRSCVVTVRTYGGNVYNPSLSMTLGVNYTGTSLSSSLAAQFQSVHGLTLSNNSARISFSSLGNSNIAVTHLSDGRLINANTEYTFAQYIGMYVEPLSAGSFNVPYTLTYSGKSLTGTVMVTVAQGSVSSSLSVTGMNPYTFSSASADGTSGSSLLSNAIRNAVGTSWSFIRFTNASSPVGTLYQNSSRASVDNVNISASALGSLYFVPAQTGQYSASFIICNASGGSLATGTLNITVSNSSYGSVAFNDVRASDWFSTPVEWAVNRNITNGTAVGVFSPYDTCTTAQILTFLWRSKGSPAPTGGNPFTDVSTSNYYYQAALWAYENHLVSGTQFNGSQPCTRASTVVFLWKLAGSPSATSSGFTDVAAGTETASAVNWAVAKGITNGMSATTFAPATTCNRGQIVTFLYRAYA